MLQSLKRRVLPVMPLFVQRHVARVESSPLGARLARGAFWSVAGAVISRGLNLLASIIVARYLGKAGFGQLGMIQNTVMMFAAVAGLGMGLTANKYVAELRSKDPTRAGRIIRLSSRVAMAMGMLMTAVLLAIGPWLASATLHSPQLGWVLQLSAPMLLFGAINGAQTGALSGLEAFRRIAQVNLAAGLLSFPVLVTGAVFGGLSGVVIGFVASFGLNCLLNRIAITLEARKAGLPLGQAAGEGDDWSVLWRFSLPAVIAGIVAAPASWVATAMLFNQPSGAGEMGIFNASGSWRAAILFLPTILAGAVLPVLTDLFASGDKHRYRRVFWLNIWANAGAAFLVALPVAVASPWIMQSYGDGFRQGWPVLALMALSSVIVAANNIIGNAIASAGRMWWGALFNLLWAVCLVASSWLLVRPYGALGLAVAMTISFVLHSVWQYAYAARTMTDRPFDAAEDESAAVQVVDG